jgi:hypothetical protein
MRKIVRSGCSHMPWHTCQICTIPVLAAYVIQTIWCVYAELGHSLGDLAGIGIGKMTIQSQSQQQPMLPLELLGLFAVATHSKAGQLVPLARLTDTPNNPPWVTCIPPGGRQL